MSPFQVPDPGAGAGAGAGVGVGAGVRQAGQAALNDKSPGLSFQL
jgi:hypothetical protein